MSEDLQKVRDDGVIKRVKDIIFSNDKKKVVKKDLLYDEFDDTEAEARLFAVVNIKNINKTWC